MTEIRISAQTRTEFGKGAARRTRRADQVPAVVYGHGLAPRHVALPGHDLMLALKTANVLLDLDLDGESVLVLPKAVQRDAVKGHIEHVDLVVVNRGETVTVDVPLHSTGDVAGGGTLVVDTQTVTVETSASAIPTSVEYSVEGLEVGAQVHAGDLSLPEGTTLAEGGEVLVASVIGETTAEQLDAETSASEAELGVVRETPDAEAEADAAPATEG
ncbi:LSU ribosomal protein L25P [Motilibacter rhizosphaerae]|uniref:Large ribosomal subunit protein bL25 n=1 Tax=Motilibacter rhizosphaerae TaxID=598652 RepID=A0A4Q7NQU5_9ACTN|nr:50S ribosomal protein L25/general stress protein Ctc [Motilibacter rhizosphaerae]RZS87396.1 LSU ribosomal protein L25P [Motilibacter rhizosphaerae]